MNSKTAWIAVLCMVTLLLAACAPNTVKNPTSISLMEQQSREYPQREYLIAPGDTLDIKFTNHPELNELNMPVRPDGRISLTFAPDIKAAGLTPAQFREQLIQKYSSQIKKPDMTVIIRNFSDQKVFVDGEVQVPGLVELKGPTTVMRAIAMARGARESARLSNVIVIRKDFEGKPMAANLDLRQVINGSDMSQDIRLMPYDIVYVPKSNIARIDKFVDEYINRIVPGGFPGWQTFANPYRYSLGGFTDVYTGSVSTTGGTVVIAP